MVMDSWPVETESAKRVRLRIMKKDNFNKIASELQAIAIKISDMTGDGTLLSWTESKTLNVLYKEVKAGGMLLRAMSMEFSKGELAKIPLDIAQPQSYKVYLSRGSK